MEYNELFTKEIHERILNDYKIRQEFEEFLDSWIKKHSLSKEIQRGILYLMSSYIMMKDQENSDVNEKA